MKEIVNRLQENRQIELAKSILESNGYKVEKRVNESKYPDTKWEKDSVGYMNPEKQWQRRVSDVLYVIRSLNFDGVDYGNEYELHVTDLSTESRETSTQKLQSSDFTSAKKEVDGMFNLPKSQRVIRKNNAVSWEDTGEDGKVCTIGNMECTVGYGDAEGGYVFDVRNADTMKTVYASYENDEIYTTEIEAQRAAERYIANH